MNQDFCNVGLDFFVIKVVIPDHMKKADFDSEEYLWYPHQR